MFKSMDKRSNWSAVLAGGVLSWSIVATGGAEFVSAQEQPTTQKADDTKPETKPVDDMEAAKAAARASTQPAKTATIKPRPAPAGLNPSHPTPATQPVVAPGKPVPTPARTPARPRPTVPNANVKQPVTPEDGAANAAGMNQPPRGAITPPNGRAKDPRGPRNAGNPRTNPPIRPGVPGADGMGGAVQPTDAAGVTPAGESENANPLVTNTKTKMLVFQIDNPQPETRTYRFQYYDMPWQDVLDDFSRVSGLPLVNKPDPPIAGNLTYFSNDEYTFDEAYHKLNELLLMNPLNNYVLQRTPKYMTAERIPDLVRKIGPNRMYNSFEEFEAAKLDPYDVCLTKFRSPTNWSAFQVIEQFRSMFSDTYGTEIVGEDLIQLTGLVKEHMQFKEVVGKLSELPPPKEGIDGPRLIYKLKAQKAATVQTILNQLYQITPAAPRVRPGMPATIDVDMQQAKQLTIVPDITNNILYIKGPQYLLDDIKLTLERIDVGEWKPPSQELYKLQNAASNTIVTTLKPIFQKMLMDINKSQLFIPEEVKAALDVDIFPDVSSNAIIIVGGEEGRARAKKLIEQYDIPSEWVTEIISLKHIKADEAVQTIQMLFQRLMASKGGAMMMPQVMPQSSTSLLVSCSPADLREVMVLLEKIDVPDAEAPHEHIMALEYAVPSEVAQTVTQVLMGTSGGAAAAPRVMPQMINRGKPGMPGQPGQPVRQMPQPMQMAGSQMGGGGKSPLLVPNDDARSLMVYCSDKDWPTIEELVKKLDAQEGTVKPLLYTIELKKANPEDVASMINSMFPAIPGSGIPQIVTADIYNNSVRIFARPDFVEQVVPLIETLDINATAELTVIKLEHCKADVIAPILAQGIPGAQAITTARANMATPGMPQQARPQMQRPGMAGGQVTQLGDTSVRIVAEPITNSLLVTAPPKELEQIQKLVGEMERIGEDRKGVQVIVETQNRPAEEIATTLTTLLGSGPGARQQMPGMPQQAVAGELNPNAEQLKVVSNGERIILKGPQDQVAEALQIIERIDVADQQYEVKIYAVNDAETDEQKLRTLLAGRAAGAGARPGGSRPVAGRPAQPGQNIQQVTIPTQATADIQIYADLYANTLLVRALPKDFVEVEKVLEVVLTDKYAIIGDKPPTPPGQFFMVKLKEKSAWDMTFVLEDLVNRDDRSKVEFLEGPTEKDLLVMDFKPGQEEMIRKYIEMFDVSDKPKIPGIEMVDTEGKLSSDRIRMYLQAIGHQTSGGVPIDFVKSGQEGRVKVIDIHEGEEAEKPPLKGESSSKGNTIRGDEKSNSKPISGVPTSNASPIRVGPLGFPASVLFTATSLMIAQSAPANDNTPSTADKQNYKYVGVKESELPGGMSPDRVQIYEDPNTGQLMFFGPTAAVEELKELIETWMEEDSPTVVRVFPLKYADVNTAAQLLNQVFNQQAAPQAPQARGRGQQPGQQQNPQQQQIDPNTGKPMPQQPQPQPQVQMPQPGGRGGASGGAVLKVVADERTKSLFVVARQSDIPLIIEVLRRIDGSVVDQKNLRIFKLKTLQAEDVVASLREILGIEQSPAAARGRGRGQPGQPQGQGGEQQIIGIPGAEAGATVSADKIKLTAEAQTNTVWAQAPSDTLELIAGLIKQLEELEVGTEWDMQRFELKHARATDIAEIVDDLARELLPGGGGGQQQQQQMQGGPGGGRQRRAGVNRVLVEADPRTNSVIVAGQAKDREVVGKIIKDLDVDEGDNTVRQFTVKGLPSELVPSLKDIFVNSEGGRGRGGDSADIIISAQDATKVILVKAPAPQMAEIEKQILAMDQKIIDNTELRTIKLLVANAETVGTKLTEVFAQSGGGRGGRQGEISIKGIKANNTLYVRCPDDMFEKIKTYANSMDTAPSDVQVKRFPLKNAVAQDVYQRVQALLMSAMTGPASTMNLDFIGLTPDPRTNSLVLVGGPTSAMLLASLISEVDVAPDTPMVRSTAAYTLPAGQDVNQVVNNIMQMFQGVSIPTTGVEAPRVTANASANLVIVEANAEQQLKIKTGIIDPILNNVEKKSDYVYQVKNAQATQLANTVMAQVRTVMSPINNRYPVNITGDDGANALLINASEKDYQLALAMITPLDVEPQDRITKAFKVKYVAPWTMAGIINAQFTSVKNQNERVIASFEDGTLSIIVTANAKNMEAVGKLIEETDKPGQPKETRFVQLKEARADEVARAIDATLRSKVPVPRSGQMPFSVTPDLSSNVIVVSAEAQLFPEIDELVKQLDVPAASKAEMERKNLKLTYADPGAVANNIRQSYQSVTGNPSPRDRVTVTENWTSNSIFVTASKENMARIEADVTAMDGTDSGVRISRVIEVGNANPNDVAQALQALWQDIYRNKRQQTPPTIKAIPGTTQIIVFANDDEFKQTNELISKIDIDGGRLVHSVTLPEQVPAKGVADNINQLFGSRGGPSGDGPKANYHEPTNTVLVSATDAEFEKINRQVIEPLSKLNGKNVLNFYKIALKYAVAEEVATTLQEFFDKKSGATQNRNMPPWMRSSSTEAQDNLVTVMAETGSNTLLIFATETTKKLIDELVTDIDIDRDIGKSIAMVALQYQDAKEMLEVMTEMLRVQKRTSDKNDEIVPWWFDGRREEEKDDEAVLAGGMRLKAIESSNSLIISGKKESVEDAVAKIKELDVPGESGLVPTEYVVTNGRATDMAETLKKIHIEGQSSGRAQSTGPKLTIVADEASNKLFVRGKVSEVSAVIENAKSMDSAIQVDGTGIQLVQVPGGQNVTNLADLLSTQINNRERDKASKTQGYKADLVTITPDTRSNTMLVSGSKANIDEIKNTVQQLVAMGPPGGRGTRILNIKNLSSQQIQEVIQQLQQNQGGNSSGGRGGRGPRGDAKWTNNRRYEKLIENNANGKMPMKSRKATTVAATIPVLMMQLALGTAVAQTTPPKNEDAKGPKVSVIRPRVATTQPAAEKATDPRNQDHKPITTRGLSLGDTLRVTSQPVAPAGRSQPNAQPRANQPAPRTMNDLIAASTQPAGFGNWSQTAKDAFQLTGAEVTVTEAGPGQIVIDGLESDLDTIEALVRVLQESVPDKQVEYRRLVNANATDLAQVLTQVFVKIQAPSGGTPLPQDIVDIIADARTNGIYVAASVEKMKHALKLIEQADTKIDITRTSRSFVFKNRRVMEAGEVLKKLTDASLKQRKLDPSLISVEIDPQTNAVFVTAGEGDMETVMGFVEVLDAEITDEPDKDGKTSTQGRADIMVVPLRVAKADTLATLLTTLLQKAATGDTPMKDFIRRLRLLDENGNPLATVDLNKPIVVAGDPDSNSLMIASTVENCLIMKQVALAFDKEPAKAEVASKVYSLKYADAEEVATRFNDMLTDSENLTKRPGLGDPKGVPDGDPGVLVYKAVVKADTRTNQVIVVGRPEAITVFDNLIAQLDVQGRGIMPFEIVRLEFASPTGLATALTEMLDKRKETITGSENTTKTETVIITPDARSQSLIIAAKLERMEELKGLIKQLDVKTSALVENIRTITLKKSTATELADKLKDLWTQTREQREGGEGGGLGFEIPAIVADERSNSLIVSASLSDFESIKGVVDKIENLELNPMANIYIVRMKYNSASELQGPLQSLFEARAKMRGVATEPRPEDTVSIEVDEATNSLLVAASRENIEVLMEKVKELDVEVGVVGQIEFFKAENVTAARLKEVIDSLFEDRLYKPGASASGEGAETREKVTTVVDDRSNVLIVTASPENMSIVREIYKRMNSLVKPWDAEFTNVIQLQHGDAVQIAAQVEDYFDRLDEVNQGGESGGPPLYAVKIFADEKRNRVIVGGTRDGIERAKSLISQLDVPAGESGQKIVVYKLQEAPADKIKEMITNIFQERNQPRGEGGGTVPDITVTVESNGGSRMLVINASKLDHALIADLIKQLDRPSALLDMVKVFPLIRARADKIKEILDEVYQSAQTGGDSGAGQTVAVVADERTNSVVVAAPPGELSNVETIIGRLDRDDLNALVEVAVIPCENEDAEKMAEILNQIMSGQGAESGGSAENENLRPAGTKPISFRRTTDGEERVLQSMRENVQITFNARSNSVIAVAPPDTLRLIKELISKLDGIEKKEVLVKVFLLRHADATKTVEILEKMFNQDDQSGDQAEFQQGRDMNVEGGVSGTGGIPSAMSQDGESTNGTFGKPKTTFVPDERTNAIIAAGWPADIDVAADILDQLDSRDVEDRDTFVYTAVNMKAIDMQAALQEHFQAESTIIDGVGGDTVSPQQKMEREVSVIAHEESNQLVVSSSPRKRSDVLSIIEQLDAPPPQVMIQVMIAEVTIDDRFEMGLEFALQELRFSETAVAGGNGILQSSHFDVVGGTDLGAAGSGLGGFSFTITGEDFNFLVRALQSDSRLEVIQRPMIMCQDNQIANITIGSSVPIPQASTSGGSTGGNVQTNVVYQDVGVILNVEPNINPDGWVYMKVAPEISDFTDSTIQIAPGVFAPVFTNRKADTFVAVKDGETVVIGGLITTSDQESESKVPILGDIPGLGMLFRTTTRQKRKTELLIALTPRIVRTVEDGYRLSIEERDKSGIITDEMKASPYFEKLRLTPESEAEISSIEDFPEVDYVPQTDEGAPAEPTRFKTEPKTPKYGPEVPRYGPMVPSNEEDEDVVARRPSKLGGASAIGSK